MRNVVRGLRADARVFRAAPDNPLTQQGYEVIEDLLDAASCERLVRRFDEVIGLPDDALPGAAYTVRRVQGPSGQDQRVTQLMHAQEIDDELSALHRSGVVEELFRGRLGEEVVLESTTIQLDDPDTRTKRGFHVDRAWPRTYKLFVYLTDVPDLAHGPYTVVAGSHLHLGRKVLNIALNRLRGRQATDMAVGYRLASATPLLGGAGRTVLSVQTMVHRGWPEHDAGRRLALICYLTPRSAWDGREFALGKRFAAEGSGTPVGS